jgi:hypothetical protein
MSLTTENGYPIIGGPRSSLTRALSRQINIGDFPHRIRPGALVIREQKQGRSNPPWSASRQYRIYSDNALPWHPKALVNAYNGMSALAKKHWIWWNAPAPAVRNTRFADIIEDVPTGVEWHSVAETHHILGLMSAVNRGKVDAAKSVGRRMVGGRLSWAHYHAGHIWEPDRISRWKWDHAFRHAADGDEAPFAPKLLALAKRDAARADGRNAIIHAATAAECALTNGLIRYLLDKNSPTDVHRPSDCTRRGTAPPGQSRNCADSQRGIVTSALFTCQTRPASVGSDEQNQ